ncbi:hypothetical protein BJ165DRAFT_1522179 [Panaeolus papilionaceus]|nr:hypothetical protein BJ165DRAFT_1522179 [Panaeolus papilionaceus]
MSLADLTRNAFQSGVTAKKWLGLCKLLISKNSSSQNPDIVASDLSNSVLALFRVYPGDTDLQDYLATAIQDGILPVSIFVPTFLQAARSTELHKTATLNNLCRIVLDAYYASGLPSPRGFIVSGHESPAAMASFLQDGLVLLRTAYSLPISHFHPVTTSVSEFIALLTACITSLSQFPPVQATACFSDLNELLTNYPLLPNLRQALDSLMLTLSVTFGDDLKVIQHTQIPHAPLPTSSGSKADVFGPSSDTDIISLGLLLNHLVTTTLSSLATRPFVTNRAHEYGAGDKKNAVALLVTAFRWSSWTPTVYYTQLLLSAFTCLAQYASNAWLWKAFLTGRLPALLASFEEVINTDNPNTDLHGGLRNALTALFQRRVSLDLMSAGDTVLRQGAVSVEDSSRSYKRELLAQLCRADLIPPSLASQLDSAYVHDTLPKWYTESHDGNHTNADLLPYLESKLGPDMKIEDFEVWATRIWRDSNLQSTFADALLKATASLDAEGFGHLCKILYTYERALDIVSLHVSVINLVHRALVFLEDYDCETVGDPQTAVRNLGDVVLFVQYTIGRFKFEHKEITRDNRTVSTGTLTTIERSGQDRAQDDANTYNAWYKVLFDTNSEGIEDNIFRSTKLKVLLRIAPRLIANALTHTTGASQKMDKLDKEVLFNGVSYFTEPLLNWTLVPVVRSIIKEIQKNISNPSIHDEVLQILLKSSPKPVLALCSPQITSLLVFMDKARQAPPAIVPDKSKLLSPVEISGIRNLVADAVGYKGGPDTFMTNFSESQIWYQQVQEAIQTTFSVARSQKAPSLDVRRCLKTLSPIQFLQLLWAELLSIAGSTTSSTGIPGGDLEACRRISTFILTTPQEPPIHPLLPIFMHIVLPSVVIETDQLPPSEQPVRVELLVAVISSSLNAALHLEWALRSAAGNDRLVLGETSGAMARRLAGDLKRNRRSETSKIVLKHLAASQSFVANFPVFVTELGS